MTADLARRAAIATLLGLWILGCRPVASDSATPSDSPSTSPTDSAGTHDTHDTHDTQPPTETPPFAVETTAPCESDHDLDGVWDTVEGCSLVLARVSGTGATVRVLLVDRAPTSGARNAPVVIVETGGAATTLTSPPGWVQPEGEYRLDDYIQALNDAGYRTVEVAWHCPGEWKDQPHCDGLRSSVEDFVHKTVEADDVIGKGWAANLEGAGLPGVAVRTRVIYDWIAASATGPVCAHGHSGGSGRMVATMSMAGAAELFQGVLFTGGPIWSYMPWYCGVDEPAGSIPDWWEGGSLEDAVHRYEDTRSCTPDARETQPDCPEEFDDCRNHVANPVFVEDSLQCAPGLDVLDLEVGIAMGGADVSSSWKHLMQWINGIEVGLTPCPAMAEAPGRDGLALRQGFCDVGTAVFLGCDGYPGSCGAFSCEPWDAVEGRGYDASLAEVGHDVMAWPEGTAVSLALMEQVCPVP